MFTSALRPKKEAGPIEQRYCPVCGFEYINEHTSVYLNLTVQVYECANQHSWEKYPGSIPPVASGTPDNAYKPTDSQGTAFQNVYRPFHDSEELPKRLLR